MTKKTISLISFCLGLACCAYIIPTQAETNIKNYHYSAELGYPEKYPIIFNIVELPTPQKVQDSLYISTGMANPGPWGSGSQSSSILESQPLPTRVKMQWFSVSENQFWEVDAPIDQRFFQNKNRYGAINPFIYFKNRSNPQLFMKNTTWNIYAVPGGRAFIWISSASNVYESYLIAELQAKKVDQDWKKFILRNDMVNKGEAIPSRADFVKNQLQKAAEKTNTPIKKLINKNADQWLAYIKKYNWQMQVGPPFELKDVEARYTNNEAQIIYADTDQTKILPRPIPHMLEFFVVDKKNNYLHRIRVTFGKDYYENHDEDWNEIIHAFTKLNQETPVNGLMTLNLKISSNLKQLDLFLIKGKHKIELKNIEVSLIDTYDDYSPIICDNYSPALQMNQNDFTTTEQGSKIFTLLDQMKHPVPYYKYKLLREDGKFYYGVTGTDGNTVRVKTFVNGKWLQLDLYEDLREGCVSKEEIPKDLHIYKPTLQPLKINPFLLLLPYFQQLK